MRHLGSIWYRDVFAIGFPVGADKELGGIPFFVRVCEEHLGIDVSAEAFGTGCKLLGPGSILRLNTEV